MKPWVLLDTVAAETDAEHLRLLQRDTEFSIRVGTYELMNSRAHGSEEALAELACARIAQRPNARVLIGGLGMGFTLAAALRALAADSEVVVAELIPAVVRWNRGALAHLAGAPLNDVRVQVREADIAQIMREAPAAYDVILLDVDNGPDGLTRKANDWLYGFAGLSAAYQALRAGGVLAVWSAAGDAAFTQRLLKTGFDVERKPVRARGARGGSRHVLWIASRRR